ncbi:hypothetical protein [Xanthomonas sp. XNM01]|uniref:hypothetical protein n=1 Tax=Xanthomonas sp. XNM01 TaxID=2769289 RepID=UPI0017854453|nr:hypothetical protein [Xanthomonas sp. XNM01]MBD9367755.1 hypothetical protein [Xanthomonas sp. XNM01]
MKTTIRIGVVALGLFGFELAAQNPRLDYRQQDPFLFCTEGQDERLDPLPCWKPIPPFTGQYIEMPYCQPYSKYGKPWTFHDRRSLQQYRQVCPRGIQPGAWDGPGRPDVTPRVH